MSQFTTAASGLTWSWGGGPGRQGWESRDGRAEVGGHTFDMKP
jgi:hypothetical protein